MGNYTSVDFTKLDEVEIMTILDRYSGNPCLIKTNKDRPFWKAGRITQDLRIIYNSNNRENVVSLKDMQGLIIKVNASNLFE